MNVNRDKIENSRKFDEVNIFPKTGNKDEFCESIRQAPFVYKSYSFSFCFYLYLYLF